MGASNHPTTVPENKPKDHKWSVTLEADDTTYHKAFTVKGPKHVQALNQAWNKIPDFLERREIGVPERSVGVTLNRE